MVSSSSLTPDFEDGPQGQDPYAGIFFSKDRTERLVEPVVEEIHASIRLPAGSVGDQATDITVRVLSRGEWMSGCPEGGEYPLKA